MDHFNIGRNTGRHTGTTAAPATSTTISTSATPTRTPMRQFLCAAMLVSCSLSGPFLAPAQAATAATTPSVTTAAMQKPAQPESIVMVPDEFLRPWDPVTLFFPESAAAPGPQQGGPADTPEKWVTLEPAHPGGWTWLDDRTLQFRPAIAWPPLQRFNWSFAGESLSLATLLAPPASPPAAAPGADRPERRAPARPSP